MTQQILISGATVIDTYTGEKEIKDILIVGDRITDIGDVGSLEIPSDTTIIDATGKYAIPGLWDAHIHLTLWPEVEDRLAALLTAYGITSVRDMGASLEKILTFRNKAVQEEAVAPRIWFAGPYINSSPAWGHPMSAEADTAEEVVALVDTLVEAGIHFIKAYEMLKPEVFEALIKRAEECGLKVAGHTPISLTIREILDLYPRYDIQHLGGQCSGMKFECACHSDQLHEERVNYLDTHRATAKGGYPLLADMENAITVALSDQDPEKRAGLINLFVEKGTWHTPTLVVTNDVDDLGFSDHPERLDAFKYLPKAFVEKSHKSFSSMKKRLAPRMQWGPWYAETVGLMHKAGVQFLAGTDSPPSAEYTPGLALHFELQALVQAGLTPLAALQSATLNPAKFFDIESDFGSIAKGKYADMILLEKDPLEDIENTRRITNVMSRGQHFDQQALDGIFAKMVENQN